jgi:hypothetical protein
MNDFVFRAIMMVLFGKCGAKLVINLLNKN